VSIKGLLSIATLSNTGMTDPPKVSRLDWSGRPHRIPHRILSSIVMPGRQVSGGEPIGTVLESELSETGK
jgi:hypothetical protein